MDAVCQSTLTKRRKSPALCHLRKWPLFSLIFPELKQITRGRQNYKKNRKGVTICFYASQKTPYKTYLIHLFPFFLHFFLLLRVNSCCFDSEKPLVGYFHRTHLNLFSFSSSVRTHPGFIPTARHRSNLHLWQLFLVLRLMGHRPPFLQRSMEGGWWGDFFFVEEEEGGGVPFRALCWACEKSVDLKNFI